MQILPRSLRRALALAVSPSFQLLCCGMGALLLGCSASGEGADGVPTFGLGGASTAAAGAAGSGGGTSAGLGGGAGSNEMTGGLGPAGNTGGSASGGMGPIGMAGAPAGMAGAGGSMLAAGAGGAPLGIAGMGGSNAGGTGADCGDPSVLFCDDFEAQAAGAFPSSAAWLPEAGGCGSHTVASAVPANSGAQVLQATGAGYPGCMVHADVSGQDELYLRSWIRLGSPSTDSGHHVALLELGPSSTQDDPELRIGMRADAPCTDPGIDVTVGGLNMGERTECSGVDLNADQWYCFQAHVLKLGGSITFDVRVDGAEVVPQTTYEGLQPEWTDALFFKFGRASYGGNNTWSVWHDDVAVGTSPIGCD